MFHDIDGEKPVINLVGRIVRIDSKDYLTINVPRCDPTGGGELFYNFPAEFVYLVYSNIAQAKQMPQMANN